MSEYERWVLREGLDAPRPGPPEPSDPLTALVGAIPKVLPSDLPQRILAHLTASGYTLVPAERLVRLERIEAAARVFVDAEAVFVQTYSSADGKVADAASAALRTALSESEAETP